MPVVRPQQHQQGESRVARRRAIGQKTSTWKAEADARTILLTLPLVVFETFECLVKRMVPLQTFVYDTI